MSVVYPVVLVGLIFAPVARAQTRAASTQGYVNVAALSYAGIAGALVQGGQIRLCRVEERVANPPSGGAIERGRVRLTVVRTISGPPRRTLDLAYAVRAGLGPTSDYVPIWPDRGLGRGALLLLIVIPNGYNPGAEPTPQAPDLWAGDAVLGDQPRPGPATAPATAPATPSDGAASFVRALAGKEDPVVARFEEIARLFELRGRPEEAASLAKAVEAADDLVLRYVTELAAGEIGKSDPAGAVDLLERCVRAAVRRGAAGTDRDDARFDHCVRNLADMTGYPMNDESRRAAFGSLARLAADERDWGIHHRIADLGRALQARSPAHWPAPDRVVTTSQAAAIEAVARSVPRRTDSQDAADAEVILRWLGRR